VVVLHWILRARGQHINTIQPLLLSVMPTDIKYIETRRDNTVDTYHNKYQIADPYRFLEDPESKETQEWIAKQNEIFYNYIKHIPNKKFEPKTMKEMLTKMMDFEKVSSPFKRGDRIFYYKNDGLQNQYVLYMKDYDNGKGLSAEIAGEVFIDPNKFSEDGTSALGSKAFSKDGEYFAYGICDKGSDWQAIHVTKVSNKEKLPEVLQYCKFASLSFDCAARGFFYTRYPPPKKATGSLGSETEANENQAIYYHRLNTPQEQDILVFKNEEHPEWMYGVETTNDGKYLVITISESTAPVNRLYIASLNSSSENLFEKGDDDLIKVDKVVDNFDADYDYLTNDDTIFYFKTNLKAKRSKIIKIDLASKDREPQEIISESDDPLEYAVVAAQKYLICHYIHNVQSVLRFYDLDGNFVNDIELPAIGSISGLSARREDPFVFYTFSSFTYPGTIYSYDFEKRESTVFYETKTSDLVLQPNQFETKQVWYSSKDGTKVPMFIIHKKELDIRSGDNPTWLYGYGGFSISLTPYFSILRVFYLQYFNGVYALANIRGGSEFGEEWHDAAIKEKKQNSFDDMIAAAEYLIDSKITRPEKLWINGGSNGGLLVAACVNQRPDLFAAAVPQVGVLDMLRFHLFTIGKHWTSDYGCSDNEADFEYLIKYSPLHNIRKDKQYPSILVVTSDHDDRVVPLHSFKYIAELQYQLGKTNDRPLLIRIETKAGHGAGKPLSKTLEEWSEIFAFIAKELKL
jgi:prolyl oligopeptidase